MATTIEQGPGAKSTPPAIILDNVMKVYGKGRLALNAINGVSMSVDQGEVVTVMGPSGSGKTTLLNLLGAMDAPTSGSVRVDGYDIGAMPERKLARFRRFSVGFVFQNFFLLPNLDVIDNIITPVIPYNGRSVDNRVRALQLLDIVGLAGRGASKVRELSGGQAQRVAIARALMNDPKIILADEPTGNLDSENGKAIVDLLLSLTGKGKTIVIVTHDPRIGAAVRDHPRGRNIWMQDGKISGTPTYDQYCWA